MSRKSVFLILVLAVIFFVGILDFFQFKFSETFSFPSPNPTVTGIIHKVVLNKEGFSPQETSINQDDTVEFSSISNEPFWPASDLHPTHGIYPEFDPQEPVEASGSWKFQFNKKGSWKYHDHLNPYLRGTIIVK